MSFSDWISVKLDEVISIKHGYAFKGKEFSDIETKNILLTPGNFKIGGGYQDKKLKFYNEHAEFPSEYILNTGDLLVTMTDLSKDGDTLGYPLLVPNVDGRIFLHNQRLGKVVFKNSLVDKQYLYYLFCSKDYRNEVLASATGTTVKHTAPSRILNYSFLLPSLNEQKAIADILSSLDERIELNNQMNETLEEMAEALFKRWFVDFEFPNEEGQPYKSSGGEMVESELGMIPKGWEITTLDSICSLLTKSVKPFQNPEVLYEHFSLPACDEGKLPIIEFGKQISSNKYIVDNTCILISKLNPTTKRIWDPVCKENSICSTEFMVYQPKNYEIKSFCYELINSDRFTEYLLCNVTGSTGSRQRVQPKLTLKYQFAISSRSLIEQFSDLVKPMHDKVKSNIEENRILKQTRDTLLPKLMSGEIRVSELES